MAQRRSLAWSELRVGILVIASFFILALAIFYIGGDTNIFGPKYTLTAYFSSANGLTKGAEVTLEGVTVGNVDEVRISKDTDPARAVEADLRLDAAVQSLIRSDSVVAVQTAGLLGDRYVDITRGSSAGQVVNDGGTLQGMEAGDIKQIITGTNDFIANLEVLSDQVKKMAERVDRGEGTLGKVLTDSSMYDNLNLTVREANALVRDARTGNGTVGRLLSDDALYRQITTLTDHVDMLISKIDQGNGTIGKLINDPSVYNNANDLVVKFQALADRIDRGEGTLGKLSKDDALYNDLRETMGRVNGLIAAIENGDGTAGKLIKDPALFNNANQATSEIQKLLYDFRQDPKKFLTINFKLF